MNPYSQDNNQYQNQKIKKTIFTVAIVFVIIVVFVIVYILLHPSQETKYIRSATAAARQITPNAKIQDITVADGFAMATVRDPTAKGQANVGSKIVFKVNRNGSMKQIAEGSSLSTLYLLGLGINLTTQAKITGNNIVVIKQNLVDECAYDEDGPGYNGFEKSFSPGGWQIDAGTLDDLQNALSKTIAEQNIKAASDKSILCVNATQKNSNLVTDKATLVTTYTLQVQFVRSDGTLMPHAITFSIGPDGNRNYTIDGKNILNIIPKKTYSI